MAELDVPGELYQPDSTVTSARARDISARISRFCLRNDYIKGKPYAAGLSDEDLTELHVAKQAVALHVQDGDYLGTETIIQRVQLAERLEKPEALLDENIAMIALLAAWVDFAINLNVDGALRLVEEIDQIYMIQEWDVGQHFESAESKKRVETILQQRHLWQLSDPATYDDSIHPVTDTRVEIEDAQLHILRKACDAGMYSSIDFYRRLQKRIPPMIEYLSAKRRRLQHATLVCIWLPVLPQSVPTSTRFQDYLETLTDPDMRIIKAVVLSKLVGYFGSDNKNAADEYFHQAATIYAEEDCPTHSATIMLNYWRIRVQPADINLDLEMKDRLQISDSATSSQIDVLANGRSTEIQATHARHRLNSLFNIHEELLVHRITLLQVESIIEAVAIAKAFPHLWPKVGDFLEPTLSQLTEKGDVWNAQMIQCRYYLETANVYDGAEEARIYFEKLLATKSAAIPDHFLAACQGLWRTCSRMSDDAKALYFALQDFNHPFCVQYEARRSGAAYRVAWSRMKSVESLMNRDLSDQDLVSTVQQELDEIVAFLDFWISLDQQAGRTAAVKEKSGALANTLWLVVNSPQLKGYEERWEQQTSIVVNHMESHPTAVDFAPVMQMVKERRFADALQFCDDLYQRVVKDDSVPLREANLVVMAVAMLLHSTAVMGEKAPDDVRKSMLIRQYDLITSDLQALRLALNENFILRAAPLMWTFIECVKFWPERKAEYVHTLTQYFEQAHELCASTSRRITSGDGIQYWLRKRTLGSSFTFSHVCKVAAEFFLRCELYMTAWDWIQRGRTQALRDVLSDRTNARQRLRMSLERKASISNALSEEQRLVLSLDNATPAHYFEAFRQLNLYRASMRKAPLLQQIIEGPEQAGTMQLNSIDDIWALKPYLPEQCDIVLVDWFIDTKNVIWRLDATYELRNVGPRYTWGYIQPKKLEEWRRSFLQFPPGKLFPLEGRLKALHQLRALLTGLEVCCKPGDLIVISTPGELSGIPIHGIPFDGRVMIERNPVVYSGGLSLFRQCLERATDQTSARATSFLQDGVFMSAYEQEGFEDERADIFTHLETTAESFGATKLLGDKLTVDSIQKALRTAPWIHYHGHAYYAKTEALNQCLVLGRLSEEQRDIQSRSAEDMRERLAADMPFEAPLTDREATLSSHLLEGSSRLTVADVFTMDLSTTSPVVVNIACDSGVQEYSPGNDPLGLVPALFCAGASSVVGTLWPIRSSSGRAFSEAFYSSLALQDGKGAQGGRQYVNLALAFREAVLAVKKSKPDPYSWAAFTLQGSPLYFYGIEDATVR